MKGNFGDIVSDLQEVCRVPATAVMYDKDHGHAPSHVEVENAHQLKVQQYNPWIPWRTIIKNPLPLL
jgi:hypothetical protein